MSKLKLNPVKGFAVGKRHESNRVVKFFKRIFDRNFQGYIKPYRSGKRNGPSYRNKI